MDVESALDAGRWTGFQKRVLAIAALAVVLDGLDNQLLGFAIPALIKEWGVGRDVFAPIVALSLIAMSIGTSLAGRLGDAIGRRPALLVSTLTFGLATGAIALAQDLTTLAILRMVAALGLGGAMPNATALLAEYTPAQRRNLAVTLGIVCVPIGGLIAGMIAGRVLPVQGWRGLFLVGGALPVVFAGVMAVWLPESPAWLSRRPARRAELDRLLARCGIAAEAKAPDAQPPAGVTPAHAPLAQVLTPSRLRDTLALWVAFFMCLLSVYTVFSWAPALLGGMGYDLAGTSAGLTAFNFGGIFGAIGAALAMDRMGSRILLILLALASAGGAAAMAAMDLSPLRGGDLIQPAFALLGACVQGVQVALFALAAHVYPAAIRATGVGAALGFGRLGAVASAFGGAAVLGMGAGAYFLVVAAAMAAVAVALAILRTHIAAATRPGRA